MFKKIITNIKKVGEWVKGKNFKSKSKRYKDTLIENVIGTVTVQNLLTSGFSLRKFFYKSFIIFYFYFYLYIYPSDLQESEGGANT